METEKFLIVGLGNPGRQYVHTRHNIGFMAVDKIAAAYKIELSRVQSKAIVGSGTIAGHPVILAKPQTGMNISGSSVGPMVNFYKVPVENVLVIFDELDLPLGTLRLRGKGGAGGHNGMKSLIQHLGQEFPRARLGIGRPPGRMAPANYVLQQFDRDELPIVQDLLHRTLKAVETFLQSGIDLAMTHHNGGVVET
ncbi:MAG: aminoacyl-tRNA hydrolase [Chloroflexi bacterium]|nr:aminoacyl-tRNA hydrolase [Chloroflexota bacterium]MBP8059546.1 aminoacyl-tRNA hydrolase [Chloroflexota bacterium]